MGSSIKADRLGLSMALCIMHGKVQYVLASSLKIDFRVVWTISETKHYTVNV